jgi:RNA-directed DNA polymerase
MASIGLQDLRRRLYVKAKAEKHGRFWGLYVHVAKPETLRAAYAVAKKNNGAPGLDGVTFEAIEAAGVEAFLGQLRDELVSRTYRPLRNRRVGIPKDGGRVRVLGIPAIRDRVVQGRSNSSWSPSSRRTSTRGRTAIAPSGRRMRRWRGWPRRLRKTRRG